MKNFSNLIMILLLSFLSLDVWAVASYRRLWVSGPVKKNAVELIELSKNLHEASYTSNKEEITVSIEKMLEKIIKVEKLLVPGSKASTYFLKLIKSVEGSLKKAIKLDKKEQRLILKVAFKNIARMTQNFEMGNHRTFYCYPTQDLWLQRSWVVKNPVRPKSRCGVLVN